MSITVRIKNVYGRRTVYPACNTACLFANLAGTETLTQHALAIIKELGYTINVQQETL